ncbi:unnamed protein product [Eretmochelys imbricata]
MQRRQLVTPQWGGHTGRLLQARWRERGGVDGTKEWEREGYAVPGRSGCRLASSRSVRRLEGRNGAGYGCTVCSREASGSSGQQYASGPGSPGLSRARGEEAASWSHTGRKDPCCSLAEGDERALLRAGLRFLQGERGGPRVQLPSACLVSAVHAGEEFPPDACCDQLMA